jgi:hypothetical protein
MAGAGITNREVARHAGIHETLVSHTICGRTNNRRVLNQLLEMGCPATILGLPEDMVESK